MSLVKHKKLSKTEYNGLSEKDEDTLYAVNENGDFSESNMDDSAELYIGDKKIGGIEYDLATETADGLMSADDKKKTNAITVDANKKSVAIGYDNTNTGNSSFVVGNSNSVTHNNSVALGQGLKSGAQNQTILGKFNTPSTTNVFAVGYGTSDTDRKNLFTIDGNGRINASDNLGFKVFSGSTAIKDASAIGYSCVANGSSSVAMGLLSETGVLTGDESLPYGYMAVKYVTVFSVNNKSIYGISIPKGETVTYTYNGTEYTATNSYTSTVALILVSDPTNILFKTNLNKTNIGMVTDDGAMTLSSIKSSTHIGNNIYALLVQQNNNNIKEFGNFVVMWFKTNLAANGGGNRAFSMGAWSIACATDAVAFGDHCIVSGQAGFASGRYNYVTGMGAMAIGNYSMALGESSVSLGTNNIAFGTNSICLGAANTVKGRMSFAFGEYLNSDYANQTVFGRYNVQDSNAMFIIGNGTSKTDRLNIFTISKTGVVTAPTFKGALQGNADTATKVNNLLTIVKGLVTYTYDGSAPVRIDLSDVSGGGGEASISIVQSTGYSAEDVMSQNATTLALYDGMPKFNGFVENKTFSTTLSPSNNGYVVYDTTKKTFRFYNTDNSTYYLRWVDDVNYVTINNNVSAPISNRFYVCNKQHYIFENGNLNIASGGSVDLSDYYTKTEVNSELGKKANTADLSTVANTGNYNDLNNKPTIPTAVTESTVSGWGFTKNTGNYNKPSSGIPKSDLASAVQTSLGKADTALQEEQYKGTVTGVKMNGTTKNPSNGVVDLGTVITAHQDISGKQDTLVSGTNIKTINGQSLLGEGDITIGGGNGESSSNCTIPTFAGFLPSGATVIEESTSSTNGEVLYDQTSNRFVFKDNSQQIVKYYANWSESYLYNNTDVFPTVAKNDKLFYYNYNNAHYRIINGVLSGISEAEGYVDTKIKDLSSSLSAQINSATAKTLTEAKQYADSKSTEALTSAKQYTDNKIQYLQNQDAYNAITPIEGVLYLIGDE